MKNPPALHEVFRIEPFERFGDENAVLADQFAVEIDFAAAHFVLSVIVPFTESRTGAV